LHGWTHGEAFRTREALERDKRAAELPHRSDFENPTDDRIGGPLGKAAIDGLISQGEFSAGCSFGKVHSDYIDTITHPDYHTDEWCQKAAERYETAMQILKKHPKRVLHAVMALAAYGEDWGDLEYTASVAKIGLKELPQRY
jgi:hypothetical protein